MAFGKEARIMTLLVIDVAFFLLEIIVGYAVGSLALVADSFHMLNDVMSLIVALYAVRLAQKGNETRDPRYSYGWQRAEILGALINGVFLLALCFSIFMEAIERLVNVSEVQNPQLVVVVGSLGLASNIVGLFLFHDHGHSHGGHGHSHGHSHGVEEGEGNHVHGEHEDDAHDAHSAQEIGVNGAPVSPANGKHTRKPSIPRRHERSDSVGSFLGHPAATRAYVVRTAHDLGYDAQAPSAPAADDNNERAPLLRRGQSNVSAANDGDDIEAGEHSHKKTSGFINRLRGNSKSHRHDAHDSGNGHGHGHGGHSHGGHSHGGGEGSMNMRGVFLHVLGDALGNVGVIASGLFIWFSTAGWRFYSDPAISFLITIIIFHSALPLVKSASFILLQGVPSAVPLDEVHKSLLEVPGVISVHELHIWQLSEAKNVASVHVLIDVDEANLSKQQSGNHGKDDDAAQSNGEPATDADAPINAQNKSILIPQEHRYMDIAAQIRGKLHRFDIHSSTIQPEFVRGGMRSVARAHGVEIDENVTSAVGKLVTTQGELVERHFSRNGASACLIACGPDGSCVEAACCPPLPDTASNKSGSNTPNVAAQAAAVAQPEGGASGSSSSSH